MNKPHKATVNVKGTTIAILAYQEQDYISLTDIAKHKEPNRSDHVIQNWMRNRNTIEFFASGNILINLISNPSNSRGLETNQD